MIREGTPASRHIHRFQAFLAPAPADPDGQRLGDLAETWLRQLCDSALHLDGYEADLASLRLSTAAGQRLAVKVV